MPHPAPSDSRTWQIPRFQGPRASLAAQGLGPPARAKAEVRNIVCIYIYIVVVVIIITIIIIVVIVIIAIVIIVVVIIVIVIIIIIIIITYRYIYNPIPSFFVCAIFKPWSSNWIQWTYHRNLTGIKRPWSLGVRPCMVIHPISGELGSEFRG